MTSRAALLFFFSALLLALSGCKTIHHITHDDSCNKPEPYQRATSIAPLAIPQGMSSPDTSHALEGPAAQRACRRRAP